MGALAEKPDIVRGAKGIIYWTSPTFIKNGIVDTQKMIDFLKDDVPNNYFNTEMPNTWHPGEEFEVHFSNPEKREQIVYRCILEIRGDKGNHYVECTLCEPAQKASSVQRTRSEEIAELISGPRN